MHVIFISLDLELISKVLSMTRILAVAEALLWRDKKQTLTILLILAAVYFNFIATGYTIITAVSKLLLVASLFLFIHGKLPQKMYVSCPFVFFVSNYLNLGS